MKRIGFIDHFLDEWHAENYPKWIAGASGGEYSVCYAWGELDNPNENGKTNKQWCDEQGLELLGSLEEVVELSDCLVVLSPDNPESHIDLCRIPLKSGKRTFIDKTFALSRAEADIMIDLAEKYGTPFYTSSALRFAAEYQNIRKDGLEFAVSRGPGFFKNYGIHQLEPLSFLFNDCPYRALCSGSPENPSLIYEFTDGRRFIMTMFGYDIGFGMTLHHRDGGGGEIKIVSDFFDAAIKDMVRFFETGEQSFPVSQTKSISSMLEAGIKAIDSPGIWTFVRSSK